MVTALRAEAGRPISAAHAPMGFAEFVGVVAGLMALNALALDVMLPALQGIGAALGAADENSRQGVLFAYLLGFGAGQFLVGSVSDRFGRKPVLFWGLVAYAVTFATCALAPSFEALLAARALQGVASAAPRVITTSVVRDCYDGRRMARVMSLAMTAFVAVPVLAPSVGQIVMLFAPWRAIFVLLAAYGLAMLLWTALRLPETLPPDRRRPLAPGAILAAFREVLGTRQTLGYALGGMMFGAIFGFLVSAQQAFTEVFSLGPAFPLAFAAVALLMSASSFLNARLVGRLGTRAIAHGAVVAFIALSAAMAFLARLDALGFAPFMALFGGVMFLVGLIFSNFNALAMEPQGHVAGTASSLIGSVTTLLAAAIGTVIGQAYDGTLAPLSIGFLSLGCASLAAIAATERGRLFGRGGGS